MQTRAAILDAPGSSFRIGTLDLEAPRRGEVLVRVLAAGVCHSDWNLVTGATRHAFPVVAGHEGAGVVEEVGPGTAGLRPGDPVVLSWAPACGSCFFCLEGRPALCSSFTAPLWAGTLLDGTTRLHDHGAPVYHFCGLACFAERAVVPEAACVRLAAGIPAPVAALIGCAVTTGVGAVLNTARVRPGSSVAVFGAGGVGLSIILGARLSGASPIIAVDRMETRLAVARAVGADQGHLAGSETLERIRAATGGRGADYVFEATGLPAVQEECLGAARAGGTVVLVGISPMGSSTNLPGAIITREEKTVIGCYYGSANPPRDFPLYARLYREGRLDLDRLVSKTYPLDEINEAYADMLAGKVARGVIVPA